MCRKGAIGLPNHTIHYVKSLERALGCTTTIRKEEKWNATPICNETNLNSKALRLDDYRHKCNLILSSNRNLAFHFNATTKLHYGTAKTRIWKENLHLRSFFARNPLLGNEALLNKAQNEWFAKKNLEEENTWKLHQELPLYVYWKLWWMINTNKE